jgi:hypothetical protein
LVISATIAFVKQMAATNAAIALFIGAIFRKKEGKSESEAHPKGEGFHPPG